jgi:hypothetical protein
VATIEFGLAEHLETLTPAEIGRASPFGGSL